MKLLQLISLFLFPALLQAQIITTVAGGGMMNNSGDSGLAINASLYIPVQGAFDKNGNFYIAVGTGNKIRRISRTGIITTVAGTGSSGFSGDGGLATTAKLKQPVAVAVDTSGNIYIADAYNNRIRKMDISTGIISTIAGNGTAGYNGDGILAVNAELNSPEGICVDKSNNIYISDNLNHRIRKIDTAGIIYTIAGTGVMGYNGDGGLADSSNLGGPCGIICDDIGNLFIADLSGRIRKVDTAGIISTIAGTGTPGYSGDGGLATNAQISTIYLARDKYGNIYSAENTSSRIRKINPAGVITTVAGNGSHGFSGDGGNADLAIINNAQGVAVDSCGNVYISDSYNYRIRKITYYTSCENGDTTNAVNDISIQSSIHIYPNPTQVLLHIDDLGTQTNYLLMDIIGVVVKEGILQKGNNEINTSSLPTGIYYLKLTNNQSDVEVEKIIKQ